MLSLYNNSATCAASYLLFTERYGSGTQDQDAIETEIKGIHSVLVFLNFVFSC